MTTPPPPPPPPPPAVGEPLAAAQRTPPSPRRKPWTAPKLEKGKSLNAVRFGSGGVLADATTPTHATRTS